MSFQITTDPLERAHLLAVLKQRHMGMANAAKKRDLIHRLYGAAAADDESYNNMIDRKIRKMIEELIHEGHPICSSARCGYWYAASLSDGLASVTENKSRAMTQLNNVNLLEENIKREYGGQLNLL